MPEYVPTTEDVREAYGWSPHDNYIAGNREAAQEAFDRWLAAHDREIATRAADPVTGSFYVARLFRSGTEGSAQ